MGIENATPTTLLEATRFFADPDTCLKAAIQLRWGHGPVTCPTCGATDPHFIASRRIWRCSQQHSRRQFSVKVGTVMEDSPIPLDKWMVAIWLLANAKNGVSSYELHRAIGVTQKTAWFLMHRIRLAMQDDDGGKLDGGIEIDETFIGAKARNMHYRKRARVLQGRKGGMTGKVAVMGLLQRHPEKGESRVRLRVVQKTRRGHLLPHITENVEQGANVFTDAMPSYETLYQEGYIHNVIDHAEKYVDGQVHTNGMENFWSLLKRALHGTYVSVEPFHLFRYLDEQSFRFNNRKLNDAQRFAFAASAIVGKRLTYKTLIGKDMLESRTN